MSIFIKNYQEDEINIAYIVNEYITIGNLINKHDYVEIRQVCFLLRNLQNKNFISQILFTYNNILYDFYTQGRMLYDKTNQLDEDILRVIYCLYYFYNTSNFEKIQFFQLLNKYKIQNFIMKAIPVQKSFKDISLYREFNVWNIYQGYRTLFGDFYPVFVHGFIHPIGNNNSLFLKNKKVENSIIMVFRHVGSHRQINEDSLFTIIFLVCTRLIVLHLMDFIHSKCLIENFIYDFSSTDYTKQFDFEEFSIANRAHIYQDYELIDFCNVLSFNEVEKIKIFANKYFPEYKSHIDRVARISYLDFAVATSILDIYSFIMDLLLKFTNNRLLNQMKNYIEENYKKYLFNGKIFGGKDEESINIINEHQSIFFDDDFEFDFIGANELDEEKKGTFHITIDKLPVYKFMKNFYS